MENCCNTTGSFMNQPAGIKNVVIQKKLDSILAKIHSRGLSLREGLIIFDWFQKHPDQQNTERDSWTYRGVWNKLASLVAEIEQLKNQYWQLTNTRISTGPELENDIKSFPGLGKMSTTKILIIAGGLIIGYCLLKK